VQPPARVLAIAAACSAAAGCGGHVNVASNGYAGLSKYDAAAAAHDALDHEEADPRSPLYRKRVAIAKLEQGERSDGRHAWLVRLATGNGGQSATCMWIWGRNTAFETTYDYEVDNCPPSGV
jgi:hypothetical protein